MTGHVLAVSLGSDWRVVRETRYPLLDSKIPALGNFPVIQLLISQRLISCAMAPRASSLTDYQPLSLP